MTGLLDHLEAHLVSRSTIIKVGRYNYKVATNIGCTTAGAIQALSVLDNDAGSNFIHEDTVPVLRIAPSGSSKESLGFIDATGRALKLKGTTVLTVISRKYTLRAPFLVFERLFTDVILACD